MKVICRAFNLRASCGSDGACPGTASSPPYVTLPVGDAFSTSWWCLKSCKPATGAGGNAGVRSMTGEGGDMAATAVVAVRSLVLGAGAQSVYGAGLESREQSQGKPEVWRSRRASRAMMRSAAEKVHRRSSSRRRSVCGGRGLGAGAVCEQLRRQVRAECVLGKPTSCHHAEGAESFLHDRNKARHRGRQFFGEVAGFSRAERAGPPQKLRPRPQITCAHGGCCRVFSTRTRVKLSCSRLRCVRVLYGLCRHLLHRSGAVRQRSECLPQFWVRGVAPSNWPLPSSPRRAAAAGGRVFTARAEVSISGQYL